MEGAVATNQESYSHVRFQSSEEGNSPNIRADRKRRRARSSHPHARPELQIISDSSRNAIDSRWIVFDPARRKTFRLGPQEKWVLQSCDGSLSTAQLASRFSQKYGPDLLPDLSNILSGLQSRGLFVETTTWRVNNQPAGMRSLEFWTSKLTVWRIQGLNLDGLLERFASRTDFIFSGFAVRIWLALGCISTLLVLLNWQQIWSEGIRWSSILQVRNLASLMGVFLFTRALHELGHAIACKRMGTRCPDIGLLVVFGMPCLYCDVSESWKIPDWWKRAAIAAAGIYVELIIATVAAWFWLVSQEGALHDYARNTMLVCSISTIFVNANPLLRFDGYYILSDWLDEANLRSKADGQAMRWIENMMLGSTSTSGVRPDRMKLRGFYVGYALACWGYRVLLAGSIAYLMSAMYANWNLVWIGRISVLFIVFGMIGVPFLRNMARLKSAAAFRQKQIRFWGLLAGFVAFLTLVPIPQRILIRGWAQLRTSAHVYAKSKAVLAQCRVRDGQAVHANQQLFQLENPELRLVALKRTQEAETAKIRLAHLERQRDMHGQPVEITEAATALATAAALASSSTADLEDLVLRAPCAGVFLAAPVATPNQPKETRHRTPRYWTSTSQTGAHVGSGTLLGVIHENQFQVVLPLDDTQLADVAVGSVVRVRLPSVSSRVIPGHVAGIVQIADGENQENLLPTSSPPRRDLRTRTRNLQNLQETSRQALSRYAAIVELPHQPGLRSGSPVDGVILCSPKTIPALIHQWWNSNVNLLAD